VTERAPYARAGTHTGVSFDLGPEARISSLDEPGPGHGPEAGHSTHTVSQANFLVCHQFEQLEPRRRHDRGHRDR
jgi:hypothetical protein